MGLAVEHHIGAWRCRHETPDGIHDVDIVARLHLVTGEALAQVVDPRLHGCGGLAEVAGGDPDDVLTDKEGYIEIARDILENLRERGAIDMDGHGLCLVDGTVGDHIDVLGLTHGQDEVGDADLLEMDADDGIERLLHAGGIRAQGGVLAVDMPHQAVGLGHAHLRIDIRRHPLGGRIVVEHVESALPLGHGRGDAYLHLGQPRVVGVLL